MKFICKLLMIGIGAVACSREVDSRLFQANEMMNNSPKEALELLRTIDRTEEFSEKEKAYYHLLCTQALDKNALTIESDSIIRLALNYYKGRGPSLELAKSYFYLGCYLTSASFQEQAIQAFLNAEEVAISFDDGALLGLIYGRLENEYSVQLDFNNAFKMNHLAASCFKKSKDLKNEYISYSRRGQMYIMNSQYDFARYYIDKAVEGFRSIGDTANCASSLIYRATILLHYKELKQAKEVALKARDLVKKSPDLQVELGLALIYEDEGQLDSARMIALQQIADPRVHAKYRVYSILSSIEQSRGDYPAALQAFKTYASLRDSIYDHHTKHSAYRYAQWYNQQQAEAEKQKLMSQRQFWMLFSVSLVVVLVLLYFVRVNYLMNRRKQEKLEFEQQIMELERRLHQLQQMPQKTGNEELKKVQSFFHEHIEMLKELMNTNFIYQNNEKKRQAEIEEIQKKYLLVNDLESLKIFANILYNGFGDYLAEHYKGLLENEMKVCILTRCRFSIKGIAIYLNVSEKTIYNLRSKIVKTISPDSSQSLEQIIVEFQQK